MKVIHVRNVQQALPEALYQLRNVGVTRDSRNGPVTKFPTPVCTVYEQPEERVMFWPDRDCNPFFHLMESLWMLGGRNDVEYVSYYVARMREFSDDGKTFHGAYGYRWRKHFAVDQLPKIIEALKKNPDDRRQVLTMWDPCADLGRNGKDLPCNLQCLFSINEVGKLDMTVTNRSNDLIWGAYGANAVHFSMLQEFMARSIGVPVGRYYQISNNLHAYHDTLKQVEHLADKTVNLPDPSRVYNPHDPYETGWVKPFPIMSTNPTDWQDELLVFLDHGPTIGFKDPFFKKVVFPIYAAYNVYKNEKGVDRYDDAIEVLDRCKALDWKLACVQWLERRKAKFLRASDDGVAYD